MKCIVFYENWQMECCGKAFSIGDTVKWLVCKTEQINTPVDTGEINYCYEAHSSDWQNIFVLEGKVETECAKGFDKKFHDMEASGYIVSLNEYAIKPAKKMTLYLPKNSKTSRAAGGQDEYASPSALLTSARPVLQQPHATDWYSPLIFRLLL